MMCVAGVLPHLKRFCDVRMPREIKVEVAYFIGQLFQYSRELLGLFVASQGHLIQIQFLDLDYGANMDLIMIAIDSFLVMFEECVQGGNQVTNQTISQDGKS